MKNLLKTGVIALFSGVMSLQAAEFESNVALSSDYIWRGMTQLLKNQLFLVVLTSPVKAVYISEHGRPMLNSETAPH